MADTSAASTFGFQAEVKQLLHLMVHSLYSNREIFLRELISNASDANDKLRFEALGKPELLDEGAQLRVIVEVDPDAGTLCVADDGIGMSREEIIEQLGTIAHSGTSRFLERLSGDQRKDSRLIGQFGVGFYSAFIVAEEVDVLSRRAGLPPEQAVRWRSDGRGEFTVEPAERAGRGTTVTLKLKADAREFLDAGRVRAVIGKYSDHIGFPVLLKSAAGAEPEKVNKAEALWSRPRSDVKDEEYVEFYKHVTHDVSEPLAWSHNRVEGKREYVSLLYIPSVAPLDLWNRETPRGIKLYVQKVFITDQATQFLPLYLRFVRGVVDCADLPLNVSRELLQQDPNVSAIRSALTKRVLDMLERLARTDAGKYQSFWDEFGFVLKEGLVEDADNREKIASLLRFNSTTSEGLVQDRSLDQYLEDAPDDRKLIHYLIADTATAARSSPHLEAFRGRGLEVLLLSDRFDEWAMRHLTEYRGWSFDDVSRGELKLDGSSGQPEATKEQKHLLKRVKRVLRERVDEVRLSDRLTESAACLVLGEEALGHQMRELLKAAGHDAPQSTPSLELNPSHPLIERLEREQDESRFEQLSLLILEQAILAEGRQLEDPAAFVKRINQLLV